MRQVSKHIIHCSDSSFGNVEIINRWHKERGFNEIGYHFVILPDGTIEQGRTLEKIGAHAKGHNHDSIGTCLIGVNHFTDAQFIALRMLHRKLRVMYPGLIAYPHSAFNKYKSCPNFDVYQALQQKENDMKIKESLPLLSQILSFLIQKGKFNTAFATTTVAGSAIYSTELINFIKNIGTTVFDAQAADLFVNSLTSGGVTAIVAGVFAAINLFVSLKQKQ